MSPRARFVDIMAALAAGTLFGLGLLVSGMADPGKVQSFLDLFGAWDPSLAVVMAGALAIGALGFADTSRQELSALGLPMRLPATRDIDSRLVVGSAIFGVGWGLAGLCPGPAIVALASGSSKASLFAGAMLAGMAIYEAVQGRLVAARQV